MKLRAIISFTNGPTYTASTFVENFLQPHMHRVRSYIKHLTDFIHILETLNVPANAHLVKLDIESLYTNISHEQTITSVLKRLANHSKIILMLDLLKYVLKITCLNLMNISSHSCMVLRWALNWPQP